MRSEELYLYDILVAADAVADYIRNISWEQFSSERMIRSAVTFELQTIGEAVSKISKDLKLRHPDIPWAEIVGFRNIVVHEYFGVDWEIVWCTATHNAPKIQDFIAAILRDEFPETYALFKSKK